MKEIITKFHRDEIMIEAAGSRLYGVTEICLLCMVVRRVILVAIVVVSLFNYIPPLQICNARVTRPFLYMRRGGRARLIFNLGEQSATAVLPCPEGHITIHR